MIGRRCKASGERGNWNLENFPFISKAVKQADGSVVEGIDAETHCKIVGLVARELVSVMPDFLVRRLFPVGTELIAACHDVGKVSPAFQKMIRQDLSSLEEKERPELRSVNADWAKRRANAFHAKVSAVCLKKKGTYIAEIEGRHHGMKPCSQPAQDCDEIYGGTVWAEKRRELVTRLERYFGMCEDQWPTVQSFVQANVVTGLVTVADWIGSGGVFGSMTPDQVPDDDTLRRLVKEAVRNAGFARLSIIRGLSFVDIFGFEPYPIQQKLFENGVATGVHVLEAPMGIGKTEAALYIAYRLLEKNDASGIYFALPTQLTSNKLWERAAEFLKKITPSHDEHLRLLHSAAWMQPIFCEDGFGEDADVGGSWFDSGKRSLLAPFAVGTIDQALMAVMNVKHGFVRTFGLAGKVVILDEVHSYDSYTGTLINELVSALRELGSTVLILSATITADQKGRLLALPDGLAVTTAYPLITTSIGNQVNEIPVSVQQSSVFAVEKTSDEDAVLDCVLERAENGEQVLWIENTVAKAQAVFKKIAARAASDTISCGLLHSRFIRKERATIENEWVSLYGKKSGARRKEKGRILVGTQVLEQSLDIDADFLVTQLCPTDMLLQRIGRAWRHKTNDVLRPSGASRRVVVLIQDAAKQMRRHPFGSSGLIYSEYVLSRTLEVWNRRSSVTLPNDVRSVLEETYVDREETGTLAEMKTDLEKKKSDLRSLANLVASTQINTLAESSMQTRYSELETTTVLLVRSFVHNRNADGVTITFLDGSVLAIPKHMCDRKRKKKIALTLMQNSVSVTETQAPVYVREVKEYLGPFVYVGGKDDEEHPFRIAIVGADESLYGIQGNTLNETYNLSYNSRYGYSAEKKKKGASDE